MSVRNWHFDTARGIAMRFLIEPVYCMTWIWTLRRAHNKSKSPIEEDSIWANLGELMPFSYVVLCLHCCMSCNHKPQKIMSYHVPGCASYDKV